MLLLKEESPLEMLRQFSVYFNGDLIENLGAAKLVINNEEAKGSISLYELLPGLTAWVYNITFTSELKIELPFEGQRPYYFGYNLSGEQKQRFTNESSYKTINQNQNFILISEPGSTSEFIIPKDINFQSCYLIVNPQEIDKSTIASRRRLLVDLSETFSKRAEKEPYRYFGNIDMNTGIYTNLIVNTSRTDLVGRLIVEGAVLNMLASQVESHDLDKKVEGFQPKITNAELSRIANLGDFILDNISDSPSIETIAKHLALSPKKVQKGIRFLYGCSANEYLTRIRLEHAKELMQSTDDSISEICYKVGYSSRSYFSKLFSEKFGVLPREYKKTYRDNNLLFELSYRSIAKPSTTENDVSRFIKVAREMNPKFNITGSIICHENVFFQMIEGPREDILRLFYNIQRDQRHTDVLVMWEGYKARRDFSDWSMATITDKLELEVKVQGNSKKLNLGTILGKIDNKQLAAEKLWKKVRNIIKTANSSAA